jgi:rfaE bifunctional protein kinase chain/domain
MKDFSEKKILVIGDIILDQYIFGNVNRLSPEAPILILDRTGEEYRLGGATNVARNLKSLGANVWIIGRIGEDPAGGIVKNLLMDEGINVDLLVHCPEVPTIVKTRFVSGNHQLLRVDYEDKVSLGVEFTNTLIEDLDRHVKLFDAIIISDYKKGVVVSKWVRHLCELKQQYGKIVTVDTHSTNVEAFRGATCITPNRTELEAMSYPCRVPDVENAMMAARNLMREYQIDSFLVTLSEAGLVSVTPNTEKYIPATCKELVDVTGAGDTVIAAYTLALTAGYTPADAAALANKAAGIVVSKMGTATVSIEELNNG